MVPSSPAGVTTRVLVNVFWAKTHGLYSSANLLSEDWLFLDLPRSCKLETYQKLNLKKPETFRLIWNELCREKNNEISYRISGFFKLQITRDRLIKLKILPLNYWLEYLDLVFFYKCMKGHIIFGRHFDEYFSFLRGWSRRTSTEPYYLVE